MPSPTPTPFPIPLPITSAESASDWLLVILTGVGVIASVLVAIGALVSSSRARKIAEASEKARIDAAIEEKQRAYDLRVEEALAQLIVGITEHMATLRPLQTTGTSPEADGLVSKIQLLRLRAEGPDAEVVAKIAQLLTVATRTSVARRPQWDLLTELVIATREWWTQARTRDNFLAWLEKNTARF